MSAIPSDYRQRVYAGWLGKCIGVRLGAPMETWTYDDIARHLGEVSDFLPLPPGKFFKADDDTAYPLLMIRALEDFGPGVSAAQMGETLQNYLGDHHGTIWWGGEGQCAEQAAYLNLEAGIAAPESGSAARIGPLLAEQCGGQIFSDIWGLVAPGDPQLAADYAERASSVAHDGAGVHGGRFIAAAVSAAFSRRDPAALIASGLAVLPGQCEYARAVRGVLAIHAAQPDDWRVGYQEVMREFGYAKYAGEWHTIPGAAVVVMALLYGRGDFSRTIRIAASAGWDSDCNAGNAGAIAGVAAGLDGIEMHWRTAMNDVLVAASLTGARNLWTLPACADLICGLGQEVAGGRPVKRPRFHFEYPGSTAGFAARAASTYGFPQDGRATEVVDLRQVEPGSLRLALRGLGKKGEVRLAVRTYLRPMELSANYYGASFSPQIHPGQTITARLFLPQDAPGGLLAAPYVLDANRDTVHQGVAVELVPGERQTLGFDIPRLENALLAETGIVLRNLGETWGGHLQLESFDWSGPADFACDFSLAREEYGALAEWTYLRGHWRLEGGACHGSGAGQNEAYSGDPAWRDLALEVDLAPLAGASHNILLRVQGARRSYAVGLVADHRLAIGKNAGGYRLVAEAPCVWEVGRRYRIRAEVIGATIVASVDGRVLLRWTDEDQPYASGQIGLANRAGHTRYERLALRGKDTKRVF